MVLIIIIIMLEKLIILHILFLQINCWMWGIQVQLSPGALGKSVKLQDGLD